MVRRVVAVLIFVSILYFPLGWFAVSRQWISKDVYLTVAAIVGSFASITSLLAFVRRPFTSDDFDKVGDETLEKATLRRKELKELEGKKSQAENELQQLTRTRQELVFLV